MPLHANGCHGRVAWRGVTWRSPPSPTTRPGRSSADRGGARQSPTAPARTRGPRLATRIRPREAPGRRSGRPETAQTRAPIRPRCLISDNPAHIGTSVVVVVVDDRIGLVPGGRFRRLRHHARWMRRVTRLVGRRHRPSIRSSARLAVGGLVFGATRRALSLSLWSVRVALRLCVSLVPSSGLGIPHPPVVTFTLRLSERVWHFTGEGYCQVFRACNCWGHSGQRQHEWCRKP